ncbi:uncharacterized protein A4U43_C04F13560 [Asparagus officinalis]|uniref:Uncharacterized protein n=1 Tax=Asparagus officinalis TaxID=4686 RepID=A0A5P1F2F1_ASPOF|nr:uncharacterized protein A4U43_C04F13560 [Asparagus officinalis]
MAREVEKLRAELANAEKRARAAAAAANPGAAYAESYARNDMAYGGNTNLRIKLATTLRSLAQSGAAAGGSQYGLQYGSSMDLDSCLTAHMTPNKHISILSLKKT